MKMYNGFNNGRDTVDGVGGRNTNGEEIRVCSSCKEPVNEETYSCGNGWDGVSRCSGCGEIEGETEYVSVNDL